MELTGWERASIFAFSTRVPIALGFFPGCSAGHATVTTEGRRAPALRFGDPRVQATSGALCSSLLAVTGLTNQSLRGLVTGLLGEGSA